MKTLRGRYCWEDNRNGAVYFTTAADEGADGGGGGKSGRFAAVGVSRFASDTGHHTPNTLDHAQPRWGSLLQEALTRGSPRAT